MSREQVLRAIPHRPPFLWVDEVLELTPERIRASKRVAPDEPFFRGHYPDFPLTPGVLVCEAVFQAGAILLAGRAADRVAAGEVPVLTRIQDARFKTMVRPGDTLELEARVTEQVGPAFWLEGKATVGGKLAVSVKFTCALTPRPS